MSDGKIACYKGYDIKIDEETKPNIIYFADSKTGVYMLQSDINEFARRGLSLEGGINFSIEEYKRRYNSSPILIMSSVIANKLDKERDYQLSEITWKRINESRSNLYLANKTLIATLDKVQFTKGDYILMFYIPNTQIFFEQKLNKKCENFEEAEWIATNRICSMCNNTINKICKVRDNLPDRHVLYERYVKTKDENMENKR